MRLPQRTRPRPHVAFVFAALLALPAAARGAPQGRSYELRIQNNSRYQIQRVYVSSSEDETWGADQLGDRILRPGAAHTIGELAPGKYDLKFVNEEGVACVLRDVAIFKDTSWLLTNKILVKCYS